MGIRNQEEDTLTLVQRVQHHYIAGMSTIETASANAAKLVHEFHQYFADAVAGKVGQYKTYIVKNNPADAERIRALMKETAGSKWNQVWHCPDGEWQRI